MWLLRAREGQALVMGLAKEEERMKVAAVRLVLAPQEQQMEQGHLWVVDCQASASLRDTRLIDDNACDRAGVDKGAQCVFAHILG